MSFRDGPCKCGAATYRERRSINGRRYARRCDGCNLIVGRCECRVRLVVHMCPPGDSGTMPCCGALVFERMNDRMTLDPRRVTCTPDSTGAREP